MLVTRKFHIVNYQTNADYNIGNEFFLNAEVLKSNLRDYNLIFMVTSFFRYNKGFISLSEEIMERFQSQNCAPLLSTS